MREGRRGGIRWPGWLSLLWLAGLVGCGLVEVRWGTPLAPTVTPQLPALRVTRVAAHDSPRATLAPPSGPRDVVALQTLMLELINADRQAAGLGAVALDDLATQVALAHAQEMAEQGYMSHWNRAGYGPDVRYGLAGGTEVVRENVYMYWLRYDDGSPAPISDWPQVIREAQRNLMDSPGHRANILAAEHTHVGVGIAYNPTTGDVRVAQEFLDRYVTLEPLPRQARVGETLRLTGRLLPGASAPVVNLAYEPWPQPLSVNQLQHDMPRVYSSTAEIYEALVPQMRGDALNAEIKLDHKQQPGLYHVRVWVKLDGHDTAASEAFVAVR